VLLLGLAGCLPQEPTSPVPATPTAAPTGELALRVGSKNFTESYVVAEMYAQMLAEVGYPVERRLDLGDTPAAHAALMRGDIDLYPEYTSTGLMTMLKTPAPSGARAIYQAVKDGYADRFGLVWLDAAPFNNPQALATTNEVAEAEALHSYSDVAAKAGELVLGAPPEFIQREDGLGALQAKYGGFAFRQVKPLAPGLRYEALTHGDVDVVVAFGTDGQINGLGLVLLEDDLGLYPPYQVAPVVRQEALTSHPKLAETLNRLSPLLNTQVMQALNWQVDGPDALSPAEAATAFLRDKGLVP
jgi:osmoprotectant transport system substrate-binding protein